VIFKGRLVVEKPGKLNPKTAVFVEGVSPKRGFLTKQSALGHLEANGTFTAIVRRGDFDTGICMYVGSETQASATSGYIKVH
jgi:hypothetical protein